eukprot:1224180-Rhodomonas_salina.2
MRVTDLACDLGSEGRDREHDHYEHTAPVIANTTLTLTASPRRWNSGLKREDGDSDYPTTISVKARIPVLSHSAPPFVPGSASVRRKLPSKCVGDSSLVPAIVEHVRRTIHG